MHPIVRDELEQLARVRTLLEEEPYVVPPREADIVAELMRLREEIPSAKEEDKPALLQQYDHNYSLLDQIRESRAAAQPDPDSPYFAHLRVLEESGSRDVFLGRGTRISRGVRIVDWRNAPISRLFYAYQQGEEYEEQMGDTVHSGEIAARRTITIRKGEIERIDAPEGTFHADPNAPSGFQQSTRQAPMLAGGEGQAMRAHPVGGGSERRLGTDTSGKRQRTDKHLPDIAALIDPEQFELVTKPSSGFVVVRGTAGSGKTTVALHRIAFLAYNDPLIDSDRTLVLVLSPALREYVSAVLPALGLRRVAIRDFRDWALEQRRRHFPNLPRAVREDTPAAVVRLKLHPAMHRVLETQAARQKGLATPEQAFDDFSSALTDLSLLSQVLSEDAPGDFSEAELTRITTWCRDRLDELVAEGPRDAEDPIPALDAEDDALLLYAWQLRVGPLRHKGRLLQYRHVAIDEVQDFSPLEVRVVLGCPRREEEHHARGRYAAARDASLGLHVVDRVLRPPRPRGPHHLDAAHRVPLEPAHRDLRRDLLGDLAEDDAPPLVTRSGPPVELFRFTDAGAAVAWLADALKQLMRDEPSASVALLVPSKEIAVLYTDGLRRAEVPRLRRILTHEFTFTPGVEVAEVAAVKGLEFDYVVLLETSAAYYPDVPSARRLLHVGATRAIHQLWMMSVGSVSPILTEVLESR